MLNNPLRYVDPSGHFGISYGSTGQVTYHFTHDEARFLWEVLTSELVDIAGVIAGRYGAGVLAKLLMGAAAMLAAQGIIGVLGAGTIAAIAQFITTIAAAFAYAAPALEFLVALAAGLAAADWLYGSQGVDIVINPGLMVPIIAPPTVGRQEGVWFDNQQVCQQVTCLFNHEGVLKNRTHLPIVRRSS